MSRRDRHGWATQSRQSKRGCRIRADGFCRHVCAPHPQGADMPKRRTSAPPAIPLWSAALSAAGEQISRSDISEINERTGNVIENRGSVWETMFSPVIPSAHGAEAHASIMRGIAFVTPAKAGVHLGKTDSRVRGNDGTFDGGARNLALHPRGSRAKESEQGFLPRLP